MGKSWVKWPRHTVITDGDGDLVAIRAVSHGRKIVLGLLVIGLDLVIVVGHSLVRRANERGTIVEVTHVESLESKGGGRG